MVEDEIWEYDEIILGNLFHVIATSTVTKNGKNH